MEDINQVLRYAMVLVGLRANNYPNDDETMVMLQHIRRHYGNHTTDEIRLAFDMAVTGKLEVDPNCFENFSCMYFSSVMNAYRKWAGKTAIYLEKKAKAIYALPEPKLTEEERFQFNMDYCLAKRRMLAKHLLPPLTRRL